MFAGFNLKLTESEKTCLMRYSELGDAIYSDQRKNIRSSLDNYLNPDGSLRASQMEEEWFPAVETDIFLSHSHGDEKLVKGLAGYLNYNYGLVCFIDSCVWGYANELLKKIDNAYCKTFRNADGTLSYDYDSRNYSTSHVHMIVNGALAKMIDATECLIFVNTPESIKASDVKETSKTSSPWIYSELLMATTFPRSNLSRYRKHMVHGDSGLTEHFSKSLDVEYDVSLGKLLNLSLSGLNVAISPTNSAKNALDSLYVYKGLIPKIVNE